MAVNLPPLDPARWHDNKGPTIIAVTCAVMAVGTLFVAARIFVRAVMMRQMNLDDHLIIISVISGWMAVGFSTAAVKSGDGKHIQTLTPDQISGAILYTMVGFLPGILSFVVPKLAVVCLLCRLLGPGRIHCRILWGSTISCLVIMMGSVVIIFTQCTPSRSQWDFTVKKERCWDPWILVNYTRVGCSFSAALDLYLAVYPAIALCQLQMETKKKAALCAALGIGSIGTAVATYKITILGVLAHYDFTWTTCDLPIWTVVEGSTLIIASCIPLLQPLLEVFHGPRAFELSSGGTKYDRYGYDLSAQTRDRNVRRKVDVESVPATANNENASQEQILASGRPTLRRLISETPSETTVTTSEPLSDAQLDLQKFGGIVRTDEISISYLRDAAFDRNNREDWA